jgi:hypothetical protein
MNALCLNKKNDENLEEIIENDIRDLDEKVESLKTKMEMMDKIKPNKKN